MAEKTDIMGWMKAHPYATGGILLVGIIALYMLMSSGQQSGSASAATQAAQDAASQQQMQLEEQQLNASSAAQQAQIGAQVQATQIAANAQNNQTVGQVEAQYNSNDASLIAALAGGEVSGQQNALEAGVDNNYITTQGTVANNTLQAELAATEDTNSTNLSAYSDTMNYQNALASLQAGLIGQQIQSNTTLGTTALNNQYNLANTTLGIVQQAGLNHGTESLEDQLAAITESALGQSNVGVAAEQAAGAEGVAAEQNNPLNTLISNLGNIGQTITAGIF